MHVHVMQLDSIHLTSNRLSVTEADQNLPKTFYLNFIQMKCSGHTFTARQRAGSLQKMSNTIYCMYGWFVHINTNKTPCYHREGGPSLDWNLDPSLDTDPSPHESQGGSAGLDRNQG